MSDTIINPHDHFFKATFARRETALSFLQTYLPAEIVQIFDFSTFEISKDTFVDSEFKDSSSDILYKVGLYSGGQSCIYVLFEHKSYQDRMVAFQILKYMTNVWDLGSAKKIISQLKNGIGIPLTLINLYMALL